MRNWYNAPHKNSDHKGNPRVLNSASSSEYITKLTKKNTQINETSEKNKRTEIEHHYGNTANPANDTLRICKINETAPITITKETGNSSVTQSAGYINQQNKNKKRIINLINSMVKSLNDWEILKKNDTFKFSPRLFSGGEGSMY